MKRPGWRQRSARPVKPFTIHVVEGVEETAPIADKKRGRGRPPDPRTSYIHKQVATFIHIIERLFPYWKKRRVHAALNDHYRIGRTALFDIAQKHRSEAPEQAAEITIDVQDPVHRWLWPFIFPHHQGEAHPHDGRIEPDDQRDPKQFDLSGE
jgi:hypothetical protein